MDRMKVYEAKMNSQFRVTKGGGGELRFINQIMKGCRLRKDQKYFNLNTY